jgi:hypothetical protein
MMMYSFWLISDDEICVDVLVLCVGIHVVSVYCQTISSAMKLSSTKIVVAFRRLYYYNATLSVYWNVVNERRYEEMSPEMLIAIDEACLC